MPPTYKDLKKKRASYKSKLTQFKSYFEKIATLTNLTSVQVVELNLRLGKLEEMYNEYDCVQFSIENEMDFPDEGTSPEYREREEFESCYFATVACARDLLNRSTSTEPADDRCSVTGCVPTTGGPSLKLPVIHLPTFSGQYQDWLEFHDTFLSLIHTNDSIPKINKFHYLRSALNNNAKQVIGSLDFSASNYDVAWQLLCERYHNDKLLINNHIDALFELESISKESSFALRNLLDTVKKNLRALNSLNIKTDNWDILIIHMVTKKLDSITARKWKEHVNLSKQPHTLDIFSKFLRDYAAFLESVEHNNVKRRHSEPHQMRPKAFVNLKVTPSYKCPFCKLDHPIYHCIKFKSLSHQIKMQKVKEMNLCVNCLRSGHSLKQCKLGPCKICAQWHNSMLHTNDPQPSTSCPKSESVVLNTTESSELMLTPNHDDSNETSDSDIVLSSTSQHSCVLLSTALIDVLDCNGFKHTIRALLDNGSTTNFITERLSKKLNLSVRSVSASVGGLGCNTVCINKRSLLTLSSRTQTFVKEIDCFIIPQITQVLPPTFIDVSSLNLPSNIALADPEFYTPAEVDILLNAEVFWSVLCNNRISLGKNKPMLSETKFGWLVSGMVPSIKINYKSKLHNTVHCYFSSDIQIQTQLNKFFELESVSSSRKQTNEEDKCEQHFLNTTKRQPNGKFTVNIPLKQSPDTLGDSYQQALIRFYALERRFSRDPSFKRRYCEFMQEYIDLGHMSLNADMHDSYEYILPHHGIIRESNLTTKLRTVFDGSAATSSGVSFNDIQCVGPVVQDELINILIRFRQCKYAVTSDCEKMYRCVSISEEQRCLQQILWRFDTSHAIQRYKLNTVTYGTASAPYLATRCLAQLGHECKDPSVRQTILMDTYVDDYCSGHDDENELTRICQGVIHQLKQGQFRLRKWRSNSQFLLNRIQDDDQDTSLQIIHDDNTKILGIKWSCKSDTLFFSVDLHYDIKNLNKRSILSTIGQIFDPLGLINPCILQAKLILQKLWASNLSWDDRIPIETETEWLVFLKSIPFLNEITIPRHVLCDSCKYVEMHAFSDASKQAYSACIYLRSISSDGNITVRLIAAKSRVAPLKSITIPRLELCGALLGVRLAKKVIQALRLHINNSYYWCDSMVVLGWIRTPKSSLKTFVLNRINEITEYTDSQRWNYIPTNLNPADIGSRGCNARQLKVSQLWWSGPPFLSMSESCWPEQSIKPIDDLPEVKLQCNVAFNSNEFIFKFSSYSKLQRIVAYMLRFINRCRFPSKGFPQYLQVSELKAANVMLCKIVQMDKFPKEYNSLLLKGQIPTKSLLRNLNPFISKENVIRVGGRLSNSNYDYDTKHPIILHSSHHITLLLFRQYHNTLMHSGPQLLLSIARHKYWTLGGRNLARKVTHECLTCCRFSGKSIQPIMSSLPKERLHAEYPFSNVAVDYAGPILIANRKGRGCKLIKSYICIFVCLAVRAVHVELVTELSTEAFIAALNRFIARRGKPVNIFSDNGTNFVGAYNEFSKFMKSKCNSISAYASDQMINFKFIPAYSPHFNGLAEGSVKSVKFHLKRILSLTHLTYEEMNTVLIQIEGILNSRPITPLSSDPNDLMCLTPSHFLLGRTIQMLPSTEDHLNNERPICSLPRYERVRVLANHFWNRFYREYVSELQRRVKWQKGDGRDLRVGDMVVVKDDRLPPNRWLLGRVVRLYPGSDGCIRVVDVHTTNGILKRAYNRLCPLPADSVEQDVPPGGAC